MFSEYHEEIEIGNLGATLVYEHNPLSKRLAALDQLTEIATSGHTSANDIFRSTKSIAAGMYSESALLRQKCVRALAQSRYYAVVGMLLDLLKDHDEDVNIRVEAAKGLGFSRYPEPSYPTLLELYNIKNDDEEVEIVRDAADASAARLSWEMTDAAQGFTEYSYLSVDFAPPSLYISEISPIKNLSAILQDPNKSLFDRCRAMTSLRDMCVFTTATFTDNITIIKAIQVLKKAHHSPSPFIRYQLALTLAQITHEARVSYLIFQLQNEFSEDVNVRDAVAIVLVDLADRQEVVHLMKGFKQDQSAIVRECVELALERET